MKTSKTVFGVSAANLSQRLAQYKISIFALMEQWGRANQAEKNKLCHHFSSVCFLSYLYSKYQAAPQQIEQTLQSLARCQLAA